MKLKVIKTKADYRAALARIDQIITAAPGTRKGDELEMWTLLVEDYEEKHFPVSPPDPVEAIRFRMEQGGLSRRDLVPYIGSRSKVSEILSRKRPLSLSMIRRLHQGLGIPAESLLGTGEISRTGSTRAALGRSIGSAR